MKAIAIILCAVLLFGEQPAFSETNTTAPAGGVVVIPDQHSDFEGIPDSKDPYPIIASYPVFKWEVNSASLDYDVQQTTTIGNGSSSEKRTAKAIKGTFSWAIGADGKVEAGIHASTGLNANPFKGFGLFDTSVSAEAGLSACAYGQVSKAKTIDDDEINAQREFLEIKDSEAIGNLHFTFSVNFRNFSKSPLIIRMASLPIVIGDRHIADAKPEDMNSDSILELPPNRKEGVLVMFRADMNNTKALELVNWLKNGNSPTIDLARSALSVHARNDADGIDYISRVNDIESNDSLLTVRTQDGSVAWRIARRVGRKPVTLHQAMIEINKMLRNEGGADSDFFELAKNGNLESVGQIKSSDNICGYLDGDTFVELSATNMDSPIPDKYTIILFTKDDIKADLTYFDRTLSMVQHGNAIMQDKVPIWKYAANKNWPEAQVLIAICYYLGTEIKEDNAEAAKWLHKAADQKFAKAQYYLGLLYNKGEGVTEDKAEAVKWFRKAAVQENAEAQGALGLCYHNGEGVTEDKAEAVKWYRKAADQGNAEAQGRLGFCYDSGDGVIEDKAEAVKWFHKAAEQGYAGAQYNLGLCYASGEGVAEDKAEAVKWYRKAAEHGIAAAQSNLGSCYYKGEGVTEDKAEAVEWYRRAADQGVAQAQDNCGLCYYKGEGVTEDKAEAVKWFHKAAEQGYADAQCNLGLCYDNGEGVTEDKAEAVKWYRKAADQGHSVGQHNLGKSYYKGEGVTEDKAEAVKWFHKAAEQGFAGAQYNLGYCYDNGEGVTEDKAEAVKWYRKAADQGNADAQVILGACYYDGDVVEKDQNEAVRLFRLAAQQGNAKAIELLKQTGN